MLETLQGDLGCNRRVGGLCSCVFYQLVQLEVRYVKLNLAIFHHISLACNSTSVEEKSAPFTIEMFDKSKLTTSTKVSSLYLVTTGGVLSFCHIEGQKSGLQQFLLMESKK